MKSEELVEIRKRLGLSREQFAAKIGVSLRSIYRWEQGHNKMHPLFERIIRRYARRRRAA
jgi:DNA-binding transcriptional regulator YiaG